MQIHEYRTGRNFIRVGDIVEVASHPTKAGCIARVSAIDADEAGDPTYITVTFWSKKNGAPHPRRGNWRMLRPEFISKVSQKKWEAERSDWAEVKAARKAGEAA